MPSAHIHPHTLGDGLVPLVNKLQDIFSQAGVDAVAYHAGKDAATRSRLQRGFCGGETRVMVATVAFGMGVELDGLNRVMLWKTPRCLTDLVQQMLRGGRNTRRRCEVDVYVAWNEVLSHLTQARSLAAEIWT